MKLTIDRNALRQAVALAARVAPRRPKVPILGCARLTASPLGLEVAATDQDIFVRACAAADVATAGAVAVSAASLRKVAAALPPGAVTIAKCGADRTERLRIEAGSTRFDLVTLAAEELPELTIQQPLCSFLLPTADLARMIDRVRHAISRGETRYYLNGMYMHPVDAGLRAVATDGHRLVWHDVPLPDGAGELRSAIIPIRATDLIRILLRGGAETIKLSFGETQVVAEAGGTALVACLIDGTFPNYLKLIPQSQHAASSARAADLLAALRRVTVISPDQRQAVRLEPTPNGWMMAVHRADLGEAAEAVPGSHDGPARPVAFNARYLTDVLRLGGGDELLFRFGDSDTAPTLIEPRGDPATRHFLMPMRV